MPKLQTLTRDKVIEFYSCSHGDLGRLLRDKLMPLPVRIEGEILWYLDELEASREKVSKILNYRKKH